MPILIDTNTYTAYQKNEPEAVQIIEQVDSISINPIVLGELWSGFEKGSYTQKNIHQLIFFMNIYAVTQLTITSITSKFYAQLKTTLEKKGRKIPTNDMWIAANALEYNLHLFTYDKHFQHIPDLKIIRTIDDLINIS